MPWLKEQSDTFVLALTATASILVMGYSRFISHRLQRRLDEVQVASQGFAGSRGWAWGATATVLLLMLPPVTNWLIGLGSLLNRSPAMSDHGAVQLALYFGLILVVLVQLVAVLLASVIWQ